MQILATLSQPFGLFKQQNRLQGLAKVFDPQTHLFGLPPLQ
jgi:hypothetical protein